MPSSLVPSRSLDVASWLRSTTTLSFPLSRPRTRRVALRHGSWIRRDYARGSTERPAPDRGGEEAHALAELEATPLRSDLARRLPRCSSPPLSATRPLHSTVCGTRRPPRGRSSGRKSFEGGLRRNDAPDLPDLATPAVSASAPATTAVCRRRRFSPAPPRGRDGCLRGGRSRGCRSRRAPETCRAR